MTDNDPTAHDARLTAALREQDLRQRTKNIVNILGALHDEQDRKRVLGDALHAIGSTLAVS
jgi:hypothetical protein